MKTLTKTLASFVLLTAAMFAVNGCHIQNWECDGRVLCDDDGCFQCDDFDCEPLLCWDNHDCPEGYQCNQDMECVEEDATDPDPQPGPTECVTDFDCAWGVICIDGLCVPEEPVDDPIVDDPPVDDPCPDDCHEPPVDDPDGCVYNEQCGGSGLCVNGECLFACTDDDDCSDGEICLADLCLPAPTCQAKADCPDGYDCVNGVCDQFEVPSFEDPDGNEDPCE